METADHERHTPPPVTSIHRAGEVGGTRVDARHDQFALADPVFYDHPSRRRTRRSQPLLKAPQLDWGNWRCVNDGNWSFRMPEGTRLPDQGWKIHISAIPSNAAEVVATAATYCHQSGLAFKHLPDHASVAAQLAKDADRSAAGKVVTVYPVDEPSLYSTLVELTLALHHLPGPWILSDLRWRNGPLSVRYGAFTPEWLRDEGGQKRHALRAPGGELIEDRREAAFTPPPWVTLPPFLQEQRDRLDETGRPDEFAYDVLRPLAFSNAGGTYLARTHQGDQVVLKEARPATGFTPDGRDAVSRLRDEHARLVATAGTGIVAVREMFEVLDHAFLVLEHVEGVTLNQAMVARTPIIRAGASTEDYLAYREWALDIGDQVQHALTRIHTAGLTHGDLHPGNIMVTPDDRVVLLDLEMSTPLDADASVEMGAPGFVPTDGRVGVEADLYALACVRLATFCPLTPLLHLDPAKTDELLDFAQGAFTLPESWVQQVRASLRPQSPVVHVSSKLTADAGTALRSWDIGTESGISELMVMIGRSVTAAVDPSRADRLWPGDPIQFGEASIGLAHGAAGVIHALRTCGLDVDPLAMTWFRHATDAALMSRDPDLGLYDGLAGAAWLHRREGDDSRADAIIARLRAEDPARLSADVYGGTAGIGLLFLSQLGHQPGLLDDAVTLATALDARRASRPDSPVTTRTAVRERGAGLMWGAAGVALFALRLYERTGDPRHLALAVASVDEDLRHCTPADDGSLHVDEGRRLMPYLASGSTGIGLVLAQLLPHLDDPERYRKPLEGIIRAACTPFAIEGGLFDGRAGIIAFHVALARLGLATPESRAALDDHVNALRIHAVQHGAGIGVAGAGLLRLSCDLATGAAGTLLALNSYGLLVHDPHRSAGSVLPLLLSSATATGRPVSAVSEHGRR